MANQSPENGKRRPNRAELFTRRAVAVGTIAGLGAVAGIAGSELFKDPLSKEAKTETTTIEKMRAGEIPTEVVSNTLVFKEGVKYRKTPNFHGQVKDSPELDNVAGKVTSGNYLIVDHGLAYTDTEGDDWIGFTLPEENAKNGGHKDASDIAGDLVWINVTMLKQQNDVNGQPFMSKIENLGQLTDRFMTAHIGVDGNVTLSKGGSSETDVAAVGRMVSQEEAEFILRATDAQEV